MQLTTCSKPAVHNLLQVCSSQLAASLQFAICSKSICSSQFAASLQFATCSKSAVRNLHQACWQLAADLLSSSRSKRCERILISAWWSQVAASLQQTCCNLRVSGCVELDTLILFQSVHVSCYCITWFFLYIVYAKSKWFIMRKAIHSILHSIYFIYIAIINRNN